MNNLFLLLLFVLISVMIQQAHAESNTIIIKPIMDTFVMDNFKEGETILEDQNFGELPFLKLYQKYDVSADENIGSFVFLKFDLLDLKSRSIENAKLIMTVHDVKTRDGGTILNAYKNTKSWEEHDITFNNKPNISYDSTVQLLVSEQDTQMIWDVTDIVRDESNDYLSIVLGFQNARDGIEETIIFHSKDAENPPYLKITYADDVPELYQEPNVIIPTPLKIMPIDDAFLAADLAAFQDESLRNINTGDYEYLKIWYSKNSAGSNENAISYALLKFDISELSSTSFQSVHLKMNPYIIEKNSTSFPVELHLMSDNSWFESEINFINAPDFLPNLITSTDIEFQNKWYSWDITDTIKENMSERYITFAVLPGSIYDGLAEQAVFYSKDTSLPGVSPYLEVELSTESGGCLIATATYGTELAPQVQQLRELRDNSLLQTESGSAFMNSFNDFYYSFSPIIADYERENPIFKEMVKISITPMITSLSILNYVDMDSEIEVLGYGISLIILNAMMYVGIPILAIMRIREV